VLRLAAVEKGSEHPIARGIEQRAADDAVEIPAADGFEALSGRGAQATVGDSLAMVVSPTALERELARAEDEATRSAMESGKTLVFVVRDDEPIGAIALDDVIRDSAFSAVTHLQSRGIRCSLETTRPSPGSSVWMTTVPRSSPIRRPK
jgi:Cu2+-exporting ATPase